MNKNTKLFIAAAVFAGAGVQAFAADYYWTGTTSTARNILTNYWTTIDGTTNPTTAWSDTAGNNLYLSNSATITNKVINMSVNATLGTIANNRTATSVGTWDIYGAGSAGQSHTWSIANIIQNSSTTTQLRKGQSGTDLFINVTGDVSVLTGILNFGSSSATAQYASTVTIGGNVGLSSGTTLNFYTKNANSITGTLTNTGGTLYTVTGLTVGGAATNSGTITLNGNSTFSSTLDNTGTINLGSSTVTGVSGTFNGAVTNTNGTINVLYGNNTATLAVKSLTSNISTSGKSVSIGTYVNPYSSDVAGRLLTASFGDLTLNNSTSNTVMNVGTLNVKSSLYSGTTGTFAYDPGNTTNRLNALIQNADIDNFIIGNDDYSTTAYVQIIRGQDIIDGSSAGTWTIGTLTTKQNIADFRLGYYYTGTAGLSPYAKYDTIDIGTANIGRGAVFIADKIYVDALNKTSSSSGINFGSGSNGVGATDVVLGANAGSITNNYGGSITTFAKNVTINGALNLAASSTQATSFTKGDPKDISGVVQAGNVDIDTINFNTANASATATLNTNIVNNNIDTVNFAGGQAGALNFAATSSAHIGNVNVSTWIDGTSTEQATTNANINLTSAATIDTITVNTGLSAANNALFIQGNNSAANTLNIGTYNSGFNTGTQIGTSASKLGNVTIGTLNQTNLSASQTADRQFSVYLLDSATLSITDYNAAAGVCRLSSNANTFITNLNITTTASGAYTLSTGKTLDIGTINMSNGTTHRLGGPSELLTKVVVGTVNQSAGTLNVYAVDNAESAAAEFNTINMLASGATVNFYQNAGIDTINFSALGTGGTVTNTGNTTIGSINVAASGSISSLDMNATVTGNIDIAAGSALYLAKNTDGYTVTTAGLTATSTSNQTRITTSKNVTLAFNGTGTSAFTGRIHDFGASVTEVTAGVAEISLVKNGTGTQILSGENYYRGSTTVNEGTLYMSADGTTNTLGLGVGAVYLNGGRFGAISQSSDIGTVKATSLTWSNAAQLDVNVASTSSFDKIILSGDFLKGTISGEGDFVFNFTFESGVVEDFAITLISWEGVSDFTIADASSFKAQFEGSENYNTVFNVTDNAVTVTFATVPEPAQFAALFGLAALLFAIRRRRK